MVNKNLLYGKVKSKGYTCSSISSKLSTTSCTFSLKANNKTEFKTGEIKQMIDLLDLTPDEVIAIFFAD